MKSLKTRHILLHPNSVKITYLKKNGEPLTDTSEPAMSYLFDIEFIGVSLEPRRVQRVIPCILNFAKDSIAEILIEYIDESVELPDFSVLSKDPSEKDSEE